MIQLKGFSIISKSDIGLIRQGNEDNFYVPTGNFPLDERGVLVGVADGMGGHNAGEVASQVAVETLGSYYHVDVDGQSLEDHLVQVIKKANDRIMYMSAASLDMQGLGTTLTALAAFEDEVVIGHVGDCRIYRVRNGELKQLTLDHSLVAEAVREGILTPEQARVHPQRNIITRALGTRDELDVDSMTLKVEAGDMFLLSSDGLHGLLEDFELEEIIRANQADLDQMADSLIHGALEQGGSDNITVVLIRYPLATEAGGSSAPSGEGTSLDPVPAGEGDTAASES